MHRRQSYKLTAAFVACDLIVASFAWVAAYLVRFQYLPAGPVEIQLAECVGRLPLVLLLALLSYRLSGLYELPRLQRRVDELRSVVKGGALLFVLAITMTFYFRDPYESRLALGIFCVGNIAATFVARRILWWIVYRLRRRGWNVRRAVVVGSGRLARQVMRSLRYNRWTGLMPLGYVDEQSRGDFMGFPYLGPIDTLPTLVRERGVDQIFVALPLARYAQTRQVYRLLADELVELQVVPDLPGLTGMHVRATQMDGMLFVALRESPYWGWHRVLKRAMDVALGGLALVLLAPVLLILAAAVKLTSRGPVFYKQERAGLEGEPFQMLKFRSMRIDAEHSTGPVWAQRDDDRCTRLGRFLRKTSLDELPQLFNVVAGHMSLVGPRPERPHFIDKFRQSIPRYMLRHAVKAGMTGWAQVHGWRGNTSLRKRVQYDLYYIQHWSPWLDVKILWLTVLRGFRNKNAY